MKEIRIFRTYKEMKDAHQKDYNEFPLGFAFSDSQFNEMMEKWGLDPKNDIKKIASLGIGGTFIRKCDIPAFNEMNERQEQERNKFKELGDQVVKMLVEEMANHEYILTGNLEEALSVCGYSMDEYYKDRKLQGLVRKAQKIYFSKVSL